MSVEQNKMIARRFYELVSSGNLDGLAEIATVDMIDHNPAPGQAPGLEGLKQVLAMLHIAFPDITVTNEDVVAEDDKCLVRSQVRGTHTGAFLGIPPSGKPVEFAAMDLYQIVDGKIVEVWHLEDKLMLMMQIGAMPSPAG